MNLAPYRRKYGAFPLDRRDWPVDSKAFREFAAGGRQPRGAAALVWNRAHHILLVRHEVGEGWREGWATPGGIARPRETPEACLLREAKEETAVGVGITGLTKVILYYVTHGERVLPFTFFQFEAKRTDGTPRAGKGIAEVAWFDRLPDAMHFRADYVEPWRRGRPSL